MNAALITAIAFLRSGFKKPIAKPAPDAAKIKALNEMGLFSALKTVKRK